MQSLNAWRVPIIILGAFFIAGCTTQKPYPPPAPPSAKTASALTSAPDLNPADATTNASPVTASVVVVPAQTNTLNVTWTPNYTAPGEYTVIVTNADLLLPRADWGIYTNVAGSNCQVVSMSPNLFVSAYNAVAADWQALNYWPGYYFSGTTTGSGEICEFPFQQVTAHAGFPAFLVETSAAPFSIIGQQISCTVQITADDGAVIFFGGQDSWNFGALPANARLFFSKATGYDNNGTGTDYWFNAAPWLQISNNITGSLSVTVTNFSDWTDGQGKSDSNAFFSAAANVSQIGLAFGGGSFYDVGIAVSNGAAAFHLTGFQNSALVAPTNVAGN